MTVNVRPAELFRIDVKQPDGTEACGFATSFAEAIWIATQSAHATLPAPMIFEVDTVTLVTIKQRSWLS